MKCNVPDKILAMYLTGTLDPSKRSEISSHVQVCSKCQDSLERFSEVILTLRNMESEKSKTVKAREILRRAREIGHSNEGQYQNNPQRSSRNCKQKHTLHAKSVETPTNYLLLRVPRIQDSRSNFLGIAREGALVVEKMIGFRGFMQRPMYYLSLAHSKPFSSEKKGRSVTLSISLSNLPNGEWDMKISGVFPLRRKLSCVVDSGKCTLILEDEGPGKSLCETLFKKGFYLEIESAELTTHQDQRVNSQSEDELR